MSNATVARLARDCKNIVAMKEATGSLDSCSELCGMMPAAFSVLSGDDSMTVPFMSVGAVGVISVATNIIPRPIRQMVDAALANDFATARMIHLRHFELFKALFVEGNPMGVKTAMALLGRDTGEMRLPLCEVTAGTRNAIKSALFNVGMLQDNLA
jgi:4-hydroxy-tetrahydrodipicolinate synthase